MVHNWINEGYSWIVESIDSQHINISTYIPLLGSSYVKLPVELKSPRKGLMKIKIKDRKCSLWCHVRHVKIHPKRITKKDKRLAWHITNPEKITPEDKEPVSDLDYDEIELPVREKDFSKIETMNNICIIVFGYENGLTFPI